MLRAKLLYAVVLFGLAAFYVLYIDSMALLMLLCALIVPVFLRLGLVWMHFASECRLSCGASTCTEGDSVPVTVTLESRCPLFFPRAEAEVRIAHAFGKAPEVLRLKFPAQANNSTRLTFYIHAECCGSAEVSLHRMRVYDMFRLFKTSVRADHKASELLVLPKPVFLPLMESAAPIDQPESERFADKPGDDPSEIFGIREYVPGDPVSRMHWKLSSRTGTLMMKEFSLPIEKNLLLFVDYAPESDVLDVQALLTLFYSLAYRVTGSFLCELAWYDGSEVVICLPKDEKSLNEAFRKLYDALYQMKADPDAVQGAFSGRAFSSATVISNRTGTALLHELEQHITANQKNFLLVTAKKPTLQSDEAAIHIVHPDKLTMGELVI